MINNTGYVDRGDIIPGRMHESEIKTNAKVRIYPDNNTIRITCFNKPTFLPDGYVKAEINQHNKYLEELTAVPLGTLQRDEEQKDPRESFGTLARNDSTKRARDKIFEMAIANKWEYMITLTLDKEKIDRYDAKIVSESVGKWFDNQIYREHIEKYLIVPELHKDGAIHFHGFMSGGKIEHSGTYKIKGNKKPVKASTLKKKGLTVDGEIVRDVFKISNYPFGFCTAVPVDENSDAIASYIAKYCTKDMKKIFGSHYKAGGKTLVRELPFFLTNVDFVGMLELDENCKTVELPERLGSVRYAKTTLENLNNFAPKVLEVDFERSN